METLKTLPYGSMLKVGGVVFAAFAVAKLLLAAASFASLCVR